MSYAVSFEGERSSAGVELVKIALPEPEPPVSSLQVEEFSRGILGGYFAADAAGKEPEADGLAMRLLSSAPPPFFSPLTFGGPPTAPAPAPESLATALSAIPDNIKAAFGVNEDEVRNGPMVRFKSGRRVPVSRTLDGFGTALAVKFTGTKTDDDLLAFMDEWGIPEWRKTRVSEFPEEPLWVVRGFRWALRRVLEQHREGDPNAMRILSPDRGWADLRPVLVQHRRAPHPTLSLVSRSLNGFMCLEVGTMIASGAKVMRCENCSTLYVAGGYDGKHRRVGRYCSNRCRVAAQRAKARPAYLKAVRA